MIDYPAANRLGSSLPELSLYSGKRKSLNEYVDDRKQRIRLEQGESIDSRTLLGWDGAHEFNYRSMFLRFGEQLINGEKTPRLFLDVGEGKLPGTPKRHAHGAFYSFEDGLRVLVNSTLDQARREIYLSRDLEAISYGNKGYSCNDYLRKYDTTSERNSTKYHSGVSFHTLGALQRQGINLPNASICANCKRISFKTRRTWLYFKANHKKE